MPVGAQERILVVEDEPTVARLIADILDEEGYVKLEGFIAPARRQRLADRIEALFASEGEKAGAEFRQEPGARRLANLVDKGDVFVECIVEPGVLAHIGYVLGPRFKLSSLNARSANARVASPKPNDWDSAPFSFRLEGVNPT